MKLDINACIEFLLSQQYSSEFKIIDKLSQHPQGLNFQEWLWVRGLQGKDAEEPRRPLVIKEIGEVYITDPDTGNEVALAVFKHEGGYMTAVDASYISNVMGYEDVLYDGIDGKPFIPEE